MMPCLMWLDMKTIVDLYGDGGILAFSVLFFSFRRVKGDEC